MYVYNVHNPTDFQNTCINTPFPLVFRFLDTLVHNDWIFVAQHSSVMKPER